ncbi:hypothetical protein LRB67_05890, partial [Borreliella bissettiae]|nr:hypothetical protein [Borreliella bissettiae]
MFEDINGLACGCRALKKGQRLLFFFLKKKYLKKTNNIKNMIISYSFDKDASIIIPSLLLIL